ncbi:MAG: hypothetical protein DDT38_00556 [Firmicutes bacterium]|nr:hypothetical protein [candidate division NPL-UPA2 bacterium]
MSSWVMATAEPRKIVMAASKINRSFHFVASSISRPNTWKTTRISPNAPILSMSPDSSALAGLGATGCASGNHTCNGTIPALMPKPTRNPRYAKKARPPASSGKPPGVKVTTPAFWNTAIIENNSASPPMIVRIRYLYPARMASAVSSCMTRTYAESDIISKNKKKVNKSPLKTTPMAPVKVSTEKG